MRALILATLPSLLPIASAQARQSERHTLSGDRVAIYNLAGHLKVIAGSGRSVEVEVTRGGSDRAKLRVESSTIRGKETLRVMYPSDRVVYRDGDSNSRSRSTVSVNSDGTFGGNDGWRSRDDRVEVATYGDGLDAYADIVVRVPAGVELDLNWIAGDVSVTDVSADVSVDVSMATVRTNGTKGRLSLDTGSGSVEIKNATGDIDLDSGSGGVTLASVAVKSLRIDSGSGSVQGDGVAADELNIDSGSGSVRLRQLQVEDLELDSGSGTVELDFVGDVERVRIDGGSGRIVLGIPRTLGAKVSVESGSGGADFDIPIEVRRQGRRLTEGTIGDGRGSIVVETGSGGVRFRRTGADAR